MYSRLSRRFIWLSLMVSILALSPTQAVSEEMGALSQAGQPIRWDASTPMTELKSGEIQVRTSAVIRGENGRFYTISLVFRDINDYHAALPSGVTGLHLSKLQNAWAAKTPDSFQELRRPRAKALLDLAERAARPLCGNVAARGVVELAGGVYAGVNLHSTMKEFEHDIFGACDFFAAGGCGDDICYNADNGGGGIVVTGGDCHELEIWGPNTCYCHAHWVE
jgi:hypothetical protein